MKQYSICINNAFCLVLDKKKLEHVYKFHWKIGDFNGQNTLNFCKNVSLKYRVTKMNDMICII